MAFSDAYSVFKEPPVDGKKYITVDFGWNNTFSRGYIVRNKPQIFALSLTVLVLQHVKSNDPAQEPEIEPRYLDQDVGE